MWTIQGTGYPDEVGDDWADSRIWLKVGQCEHVCIGTEGLPDIVLAVAVRSTAACLTSRVQFGSLESVVQPRRNEWRKGFDVQHGRWGMKAMVERVSPART